MRICRQALDAASRRRKKIAAIHKANIFLMTDGLFLECFRAVSNEYPDVETEEILIDAFAALLIRQPEVYDVIVTTNFYGDTSSDLALNCLGRSVSLDQLLLMPKMVAVWLGSARVCARSSGEKCREPYLPYPVAYDDADMDHDHRGNTKLSEAGRLTEMAIDQVLTIQKTGQEIWVGPSILMNSVTACALQLVS